MYTIHEHLHTLPSSLVSDHGAEHDEGGGHHWDHETCDCNGSGTKGGGVLLKQIESEQVAVAVVHLRLSTNTLTILCKR